MPLSASGLVTLLTDFGDQDWFVGSMKGVIAEISPRVRLVDITHGISREDVAEAAFSLDAASRYFPRGTVHCAVVDPGVGTRRRALAVETDRAFYTAPDNGLLTLVLRRERPKRIVSIERARYMLPQVSATFHGRDIFAPAAAYLAGGLAVGRLGPRLSTYRKIRWPRPKKKGRNVIEGVVVYIDRFGNMITNIPSEMLALFDPVELRVGSRVVHGLSRTYGDAPSGKLVALIGSTGLLEIAMSGGDAQKRLRAAVGSRVRLESRGD